MHSSSGDDDLSALKIIGISQGSEYPLTSFAPVYLVPEVTSVGVPANGPLAHLLGTLGIFLPDPA
jgi:hypothetical protein